jgi:hypothetical protein
LLTLKLKVGFKARGNFVKNLPLGADSEGESQRDTVDEWGKGMFQSVDRDAAASPGRQVIDIGKVIR